MKNLINNVFLVAVFAVLLASCKPELTAVKATKGSLDLTSYVAIGNSLTSGFQNGGLSYDGQQSSYVNVLANQFKLVEPGLVFNTPFVPAGVGCGQPNLNISPPLNASNPLALIGQTFTLTITVPAPLSLQTLPDCKGIQGLTPAPSAAYGNGQILFGPNFNNEYGYTDVIGPISISNLGTGIIPNIPTAPSIYASQGFTGTQGFNNMGVPGVKAIDLNTKGLGGPSLITVSGTTATIHNPFFSRFAKDQNNSSILSDAMLMKPSFFTLFIGNNDVLLWAVGGGASGLGSSTITPVPQFCDSIDAIVTALTKTARQGVIINISQITDAAYFTFHAPDETKYIVDETGATRLMTSSDMILLSVPNDSLECGWGGFGTAAYPIPKKYNLTANQVAQATSAIDAYNVKLKSVADSAGLAFFDMNAFVKANKSGSVYNGMSVTGTFVTGGTFSLDGLHLTPRGYAAVANELVTVINKKYGSTIPGVDLTKYAGVTFPHK